MKKILAILIAAALAAAAVWLMTAGRIYWIRFVLNLPLSPDVKMILVGW